MKVHAVEEGAIAHTITSCISMTPRIVLHLNIAIKWS